MLSRGKGAELTCCGVGRVVERRGKSRVIDLMVVGTGLLAGKGDGEVVKRGVEAY